MSEALDALFGVHQVKIGDASLRVRRVLTVEQERAIADVATMAAMIKAEVAGFKKTMKQADVEKAAAEMDERLRHSLITAVEMMVLDDIPELRTVALSSLTYLFEKCADAVAGNNTAAVKEQTTGFPTIESSDSVT